MTSEIVILITELRNKQRITLPAGTYRVKVHTDGDLAGLELINIYGVQVPGHEGRAGMAANPRGPEPRFSPSSRVSS